MKTPLTLAFARKLLIPALAAFAGLLPGTIASASIAYAMGAPITGAACITISTAFFILGALAGAALQEEMCHGRADPRRQIRYA